MSRDSEEGLLREALKPSADCAAPAFDDMWARAGLRHRRAQRRKVAGAGLLALAGAVAVVSAIWPRPPGDYVTAEALLASTYWQAPSDALLPRTDFDVYSELPVLMQPAAALDGDPR